MAAAATASTTMMDWTTSTPTSSPGGGALTCGVGSSSAFMGGAQQLLHCPLAPRRQKQILTRESLLDNLEILEAPQLLEETTSSSSSLPSFDWSFQNSQRSFYAANTSQRFRKGNSLQRLINERRQERQEQQQEEQRTSPTHLVEESTNIIQVSDFMSPPTQAPQTVGQMLAGGDGQEESPTGVMDFVCAPLMDSNNKQKGPSGNNSNNDGGISSSTTGIGGLPSIEL